MKKYLLTLKPLEPFFFGGEQTFGKLADENKGSYLAKSRYFPQQTALLGMLKKEILKKEGLLTRKIKDEWVDESLKPKAIKYSGDEKFSFENKEHNFGVIKSLSEVFLYDGSDEYYVIKDIFNYKLTLNPPLLEKLNSDEKYTAKEEITAKLFSSDFKKKVDLSGVFKSIVQVGNQKEEEENAFFKKESFILCDKFIFGVVVEVNDGYELEKLDNLIVNLGADSSKFLLKVKKEYEKKALALPEIGHNYIVLLSDSYIEKLDCEFAITSEISFAYLNKAMFSKSRKYFFYEKGSIFINPSEEMVKNIKSYKNLNQIGYNKYE